MELKDVILSTLAEMEESVDTLAQQQTQTSPEKETFFEATPSQHSHTAPLKEEKPLVTEGNNNESELHYLNSVRERLLVLFEGFQAPNNTNIEAKVDMTLNFLEYMLATIDSRVQKLEKGE